MADDLTEFLAARLDEDEGTAKRDLTHGVWRPGYERALREVEAKRAILDRYGAPWPHNLGEQLQLSQEQQGLHFALRALAAVYSDHPDYRQEWVVDPATIFP